MENWFLVRTWKSERGGKEECPAEKKKKWRGITPLSQLDAPPFFSPALLFPRSNLSGSGSQGKAFGSRVACD